MDEMQIAKVAEILSEWNPLGTKARTIPDLGGYRTEAIDIIATLHLPYRGAKEGSAVRDVLNQAFHLSLSEEECAEPTRKIAAILAKPKSRATK